MQPSPETSLKLQPRYLQLQLANAQGKQVDAGFWVFLQESEEQLTGLMGDNPPAPNAPGSLEFSWALYFLNNDAPWEIVDLLRKWGMPQSQITADDWAKWEAVLKGSGVLYGDGSLVSYSKYAVLDADWSLALLDYILLYLDIKSRHAFGTTPKTLAVDGPASLSIALLGDWGTGDYPDGNLSKSPSQLIAAQIATHQPDICIHLGDVYYAGSDDEEQQKLLACWPSAPTANFTLNSNHEMYDGAQGYFGQTLASPIFQGQQGASYFQITFGNWVIVGLDTAYYDQSFIFADGAITDSAQIGFLQEAAASGKQIILLSHHNPIDITGKTQGTLWAQVMGALGKVVPAYWYWGHQHNGVVYASSDLMGSTNCRCLGNGAIPIGNASWLEGNSAVTAYTNGRVANPTPQQTLRVMNGFAILTLTADAVTEQWYYQDGSPCPF